MPAVEACVAFLLLLAAAANEAEMPEAPPPELLLYLAEFEQDPVAVEAAMQRDADAAPDDDTDVEREDDPAPR